MLIRNGTVHDGLGAVCRQSLRVQDGIITEIGIDLQPQSGEDCFDASGMEVLPGFIHAISNWGVMGGMTEIRPSSNDNDEKSAPITPELDGFYAFNGRGVTAQQLGAFGVTACGVAPTDNNLFGGTIAAFCVDGLNPYKMVLGRDLGMMASVTPSVKKTYGSRQLAPMTRMWIYSNLTQQLKKAADYKEEADKPKDDKLAAIKRVVNGELPLFVSCDSLQAAEHVRDIVAEYPAIRLVLVNGFGLTGDEDWIVEKNIPVIARMATGLLDKDAMTLDLKAIARLSAKGVSVVLSGGYSNSLSAREDMLWMGAEMMRVVHDSEKVLPMISSEAAKVLGIGDKTGSIQVGKRADICIWTANPLETYAATIVRTYQGGEVIYQKGDIMKCM